MIVSRFALSVILTFGVCSSVLADCRVLYGYSEGAGFNKENKERNVVIAAGQTRQINRSRMNFVQLRESSENSVQVVLANKSFQLDKGNVDPPFGPYLTETTLMRLECLNSLSPAAMGTPEQAAQLAKAAGDTATKTAQSIVAFFGTDRNSMARILRVAGYGADAVAQALRTVYNLTAEQLVEAMHVGGWTRAAITASLQNMNYSEDHLVVLAKFYKDVAEDLYANMRDVGYFLEEIVEQLNQVYQPSVARLVRILRQGGVSVRETVSVLVSAANVTGCPAAGCPRELVYRLLLEQREDLAVLVADYRNLTRASVIQTVQLFDKVMRSVAEIAEADIRARLEPALRAAGFPRAQIEQTLNDYFREQIAPGPRLVGAYFGNASGTSERCTVANRALGMSSRAPMVLRARQTVLMTFVGNKLPKQALFRDLPNGTEVRVVGQSGCIMTIAVDLTTVSASLAARGRMTMVTSSFTKPWVYWRLVPSEKRR